MKRLDDGKVSLVEFLRSIKFAEHDENDFGIEPGVHFAQINSRIRGGNQFNTEESQLIRSAN